MGGTKRTIEREEAKRNIAVQIAVEAGVLKPCVRHEDILLEGSEDAESAYMLGNRKFTNGDVDTIFDSRREMTDFIKSAITENGVYACAACEIQNAG